MRIIESDTPGVIPVIEGTAEELVALATAATGAVNHREAVVSHGGRPLLGVRLVGKGGPDA